MEDVGEDGATVGGTARRGRAEALVRGILDLREGSRARTVGRCRGGGGIKGGGPGGMRRGIKGSFDCLGGGGGGWT